MRQVLKGLDSGEPVRWIPHRRAAAATIERSFASRWFVPAVLVVAAGCAWLATARPEAKSEGPLVTAAVSTSALGAVGRLRQEGGSLQRVQARQEALVLVTESLIEIRAGGRARLSARVANEAAVQPETIALVRGLPADVRLSDGIMVGPTVWILRPDLLPSVELVAAAGASGRHDITLELRTPDGTVVASGRSTLAVEPAERSRVRPPSVAAESAQPAEERDRSTTARKAPTEAEAVPGPDPREAPAPVTQERPPAPVKRKASRPAARVKSEVTVLSGSSAAPQPPPQPRLVWPGDDPRTESYRPRSLFFLGRGRDR